MIDYYERIQLAIEFVEKNLRAPIQVADISAAAFSSQWHFQRVFRYITGISVATYLRNRRLAEAGHELLLRPRRILDLALEFQYDTQESFARAFKKLYGINPGQVRAADQLPYFEPIYIHDGRYHDVYPAVAIQERVVVRPATTVFGLRNRTSMRGNQSFHDIPRFWGEFHGARLGERLAARTQPGTLLGVYSAWNYAEDFDLTIGAAVAEVPAERAFSVADGNGNGNGERRLELAAVTIPAGKYMVFTIPGATPQDLVAGWKYIYGTWMPNTRNERAFGVDFDLFDERFTGEPSSVSEIYIPLV